MRYRQTPFTLSANEGYLELHDSPKGASAFFNQISKFSNRTITISAISVSAAAWLELVRLRVEGFKVLSITVNGVPVSATCSARIAFTGTEDVMADVKSFLKMQPGAIERACFSWRIGTATGDCELSRDGKGTIVRGREKDILVVLRETILPLPASQARE